MTCVNECKLRCLVAAVVMVFLTPLDQQGTCRVGVAEGASAEQELMVIQRFLNSSVKRIRPVKNTLDPVRVTFDITFHSVIEMAEKHQILSSNIWVRQDERYEILTTSMWVGQEWTNEFFQWDPNEYGGLKHVMVDSSEVWLPDITLYNNVFEEFDGRMDHIQTRVKIEHNGKSVWLAPFVFKTSCHIDVSNFPFDDQFCRLKFGSWAYDLSELDLWNKRNFSSKTNTSVENGEWEVRKVIIKRNNVEYACCPGVFYPDVTFTIHLRRRSLFYIVNLILPNFLIAMLGFFSFFIPVECGERISFVITVLLSMTVFLLLVAENIPPTSEAVPVIGVFYTFSIIEIAVALVATGITLKIYYSYLYGDGLSPRLKKFLFYKLGPLLRFPKTPLQHEEKSSKGKTNDLWLRTLRRIKESSLKKDNVNSYSFDPEHKNVKSEDPRDAERLCANHALGNGSIAVSEPDSTTASDVELCHINLGNHVSAPKLQAMKDSAEDQLKGTQEDAAAESRLASAIVDRAFMWLFIIVFVVSTCAVLLMPLARKTDDPHLL